MKKFLGILLSLSMAISCLTAVSAEEEVLLSQGKPVTGGSEGAVQTSVVGVPENIVDGKTSTWDQNTMWYMDNDDSYKTELIWLNMDLEESYVITKICWTARYDNTAVWDSKNVNIYGANKADFSDKELILNTGTTEYSSEFAIEGAKEYRYLRFEKADTMGGNEIEVYGYKNPESNANLASLAVDGYSLDKTFSETDTEYSILMTEMPENGVINITAAAAAEGAVVANAGETTLNSGINEISITVTSPNGSAVKTYTVAVILTDEIDISSDCVVTNVNNAKAGDTAVFTKLFTSSVSRTNAWIYYDQKGYIDVDLGAEYNLTKLEWTKSNLEGSGSLTIQGSKDANYTTVVDLGTTPAIAKAETLATGNLDSTDAYRYIRIRKDFVKNEFLPLKIRVYALPNVTSETYFPQVEVNYSLGCTATRTEGTETIDADASKLFDGTGNVGANGGQPYKVSHSVDGYIQVDLGAAKNLSKFTWERANQGGNQAVVVLGSNDPTFAEGSYVELGRTDGTSTLLGTYTGYSHYLMSCELDNTNAYQYIRIKKASNNWDFYPVKMDLYGMTDDPEATSEETTITVPSRYYAVGDTMIAAVYNNGVLVDMKTVTTQAGEETKDIIIPTKDGDNIKLMVWKNLSGVTPRVEAINVAR